VKVRPKRGDINPISGLVYWDTWRGKERWRDAETIARWRKNLMRAVVKWQKIDPERYKAASKRFRLKHGKRRNAESRKYRNEWKKKRRRDNPIYNLYVTLSSSLRGALKYHNLKKRSRVIELFGCSPDFLRTYLERQFKPGMTWSNHKYFGWHIDHKFPISMAKNRKHLERLFHYTNLQPLWWYENFSKSDKIAA
jgi:hypothetical protein